MFDFVDHHSAARKPLQCSLHISHIRAKKRGISKKLILTIRAIMIGQQIDLVVGDLNSTAVAMQQQRQHQYY